MTLTLQDLSIGYPSGPAICRNINLSAQGGSAVALVGDNGSGKSTLLRTLAQLQPALGGRVLLDHEDLSLLRPQHRATLLAYVSTEPIMAAYTTVEQIISLGRIPYSGWAGRLSSADQEAVERAMELTQTTGFATRSIDTLSDGQRQRVMIARALCQQTDILILDEPTAFLDPTNRRVVIELLSGLAVDLCKLVIFSTHEVDLASGSGCVMWHLKNSSLDICI